MNSDRYWGDIVEHICNSTNFNPKPSLTNLGVLGLSCSSQAFLYPPPNNVAAQDRGRLQFNFSSAISLI